MSVLTLALAKTHLNITSVVNDAELQTFIDAVEGAVAIKCGPLAPVAVTQRIKSAGGPMLLLRATPVISLTSVTPVGGTAYDVTLMELDGSAGVVEWLSGAWFAPGWYSVVTSTGRATVTADLLLGVKELLRHVWDTQRGPGGRPGSRQSDALSDKILASAYMWPNRVTELLAPYIQVGN